jgi:hypothetical protein
MDKTLLLKTLDAQLTTAKAGAVSLERATAEVRSAPDFQAMSALEAAGPYGSDTDRIARSAAPVIDQFHDALFPREQLRGQELLDSEACYRKATELKQVAEQAVEDATVLLAYARGKLGACTRTALDIMTTQAGSRTADPEVQARFNIEARATFSILEGRRDGTKARRSKGAGLRAEVSTAKAEVAALQAENDALRDGFEAPRSRTTLAVPAMAAPGRRARPRR